MTESITINEVGLRDGLQNQPKIVSTANKLRLFDALSKAGVRHFEPASFVHPKIVPTMADAATLSQQLPSLPGYDYTALVPNIKGYQRARDAGYRRIAVVISTTDNFNLRNLKMTLAEAESSTLAVLAAAQADGIATRTYLSGALVCPYDGPVDTAISQRLADTFLAANSDDVIIADTVGAGSPRQLRALLKPLLAQVDASRLGLHLHDTRGLAQTLAWIGCELGIRHFDASIGGLGGCPFAPGATGNVATEDLVYLFESAGFNTGIDLQALSTAVAVGREITNDSSLGGRITHYMDSQQLAGRPCQLY